MKTVFELRQRKGEPGYISRHKKTVIIKTLIEFGMVIALLLLGYFQTKTRLNVLTIVAILGCLPASKALVEVIMIFPHKTIDNELANEIANATPDLTVIYDLVLTSEKKIMPIECIVICGNTVCGYSSSKKTDIPFTEKHIKQYLSINEFNNVTVKIFDNKKNFLKRVSEMNSLTIQKDDNFSIKEDGIRRIILNISL